MALTFNGTTGISGVDGSASAPVFTGTDSNTGISFGTDIVNINTGGSTRYQIDSSGDIQCGTANPVFTGSALSSLKIAAPNGTSRYFFGEIADNASAHLSIYDNTGSQKIRLAAANGHTFFNNDGQVLVGKTDPDHQVVGIRMTTDGFMAISKDNDAFEIRTGFSTTTAKGSILFKRSGNSLVGSVTTTTSGTNFNTTSDYRLKENVIALSNAIARLKTMKPYRFNFKADPTTTVDGFYAHEMATIVPESVYGEKDAVDSDNAIVPQSLDYSKLVPLLTGALQEAVGKIETLETKVAALEAA